MTQKKRNFAARDIKIKVRSAKGRKLSSTRWLERQLNDPYVAKAKEQGFRSRAVFKLMEIDDKHHLLKPNIFVVDLGAAPGGWSQLAALRVQSSSDKPSIFAVDYLEMDTIPGVVHLQQDFLEDDAEEKIKNMCQERPIHLVLSDMAAPTTGHRSTDHLRTNHLFELSADFAFRFLDKGGHFLAKTFQGGAEKNILEQLKKRFSFVKHVKPNASRKQSPELYVLAKDFLGKDF